MRKRYLLLLLLVTGFLMPLPAQQWDVLNNTFYNSVSTTPVPKDREETFRIATWNIRDLGKTKDSYEIYKIAQIINNFDLIAVQEVVAKDPAGAQAIARIADELNRMGSRWDYRISDPTRSPSVHQSERYAFLWKTSKVTLLNKPYLDKELELLVSREPYIAEFRSKKSKTPFFVINFHSRKFFDNPEQEIVFLEKYPERLRSERILIAGDFNLDETHYVWKMLYQRGFKAAVQNTPTTLKRKCKNGNYFNYAIDNIYYMNKHISSTGSGRMDFVKSCDNLEFARMLSDHVPVFLECSIDLK